MTQSEWDSCTDPTAMLDWLADRGTATDRKLRLFAFACCSRVWHLLPDEGRRVVLAAEGYDEGRATRHERDAAVADFRKAHGRYSIPSPLLRAAYHTKEVSFDPFMAGMVARDVAWAACGLAPGADELPASAAERAAQASLVREIFGSPWSRQVGIDPGWLDWSGGTVRRLAESAYEGRAVPAGPLDGARLAVLADALEEAGCTGPNLLAHLRGPGPHVRGCWAVDLILEKA
jgi:hypothetical protein